ncbi:hypothetical protein [Microbacterium sp. zg-YB36]|uniref:5' nucleotidase, NT5C type n=1 Tax=Microbacterium sp. zg-YB36 TaxID=2969407 RepID=UPI00214C0985|nr:hypothetical protein [Microbacterium sp. zg-YB36]MDL5351201.1 hypothetical protein [Microbacterium sp. zg-YB36]
MSTNLRILVDMDGVIADWHHAYDRHVASYGARSVGIPTFKQQVAWDLNEGRTDDEKTIIREVMTLPGFYAELSPIPGAKQALKALLKQGHDVRIVSAPYISNPTCASDKMAWIAKHYGTHWAQRLILTTDKTFVRGDVLIDDKPSVTGTQAPEWAHIVFGDYAYNRHVRGHRLHSWDMGEVQQAIWKAVVSR